MDINNFEERIKSVFGHHRPETDTDAIWKNIEPRLQKKKKRRAFIWFFWGLLLFVSWMIGWEREIPALSNHNPTKLPAEKTEQGRGVTPVSPQKKGMDTNASNAKEGNAGKQLNEPFVAAISLDNYKITNDIIEKKAIGTSKEASPNNITTNLENDEILLTPDKTWTALLPLAFVAWKAVERDSVPDTSILQLGTILKNNNKADKEKKVVEVDENADQKAKKTPRRKKSKKSKSPWEYNLTVQAGPALAIKRLSERSDVIAPFGHLQKRQNTEHTLESLTAGMFYSAAHRGLVLKAGLNYRQSNEKYLLAYHSKENIQINGVVTVTVDAAGNTIEQTSGNKTVIKTTEYSNTIYNHYRYVNLPVGVGYRQTYKKSRWEISGGMDFNVLFRANGSIYNKYNVLSAFEYGNPTYESTFRKNTGFGLWAEYAYDRRLTDQLRWQLSVNAQVPLHPVSSKDYALVQRYFNFGLQVGVVYLVGK